MTEQNLIDNYFTLINTFGDIIILWWIAGVGFCGAILKLTMEHNIEDNKSYNQGLAGMIIIFFMSLICFGLFNSYYVVSLCQGIIGLVPLELLHQGKVSLILEKMNLQFLFPTSTFILFFIVWLWLIKQKLNQNGDQNDELR